MKQFFLIIALSVTTFAQQTFGQDTTRTQSSPLLTSYYALKDALISSNPTTAATTADVLVKALNDIDTVTVREETRKALLADANAISQSKDIKVQRVKFATLSNNMFALAKVVKLSSEPVYQQYCPMKQASWLSDSKAIRNPYYGSMMLTCGSVKETL